MIISEVNVHAQNGEVYSETFETYDEEELQARIEKILATLSRLGYVHIQNGTEIHSLYTFIPAKEITAVQFKNTEIIDDR